MLDHEADKSALMQATAASVAGSRAPQAFAEILFARGAAEDLVGYAPQDLVELTEATWDHLAKRRPGECSVRVAAGPAPSGQPITVVEVVNDNMPFLVDSVMSELNEQGYDIRLVVHPMVTVTRDADGALVSFEGKDAPAANSGAIRESLIHIHVDRIDDPEAVEALRAGLAATLKDVRLVVADWKPMLARLDAAIKELKDIPPPIPVAELAEAVQFLEWLRANNFTFLGMREYDVSGSGTELKLTPIEATGLGLLSDPSVGLLRRGTQPVTMTPEISEFLQQPRPLIITKANRRSRVHRRVHIDYVGIKLFDASGQLKGELRIAGLFTSAAYTRPPHQIPYLRRKLEAVISRMGFDPESHSGKALTNILENYPRDELFQIDDDTLAEFAARILQLEERPRIRVLTRRDKFNRFVSVLVYVPRDRMNTSNRIRIHEFLADSFKGRLSAWYIAYPEGTLARLHFIVALDDDPDAAPSSVDLEAGVARIVRTWSDAFTEAMGAAFDAPRARSLRRRYAGAFPAAYQDGYDAEAAVRDVKTIERLTEERRVAIDFYAVPGAPAHAIGLKLFHLDGPVPLSVRVPVMEAMGFRAIEETSVTIAPAGMGEVVMHDTLLERVDGVATDFAAVDSALEAAFMAVWARRAESDALNTLVLTAGLGWREVALIRTISRYLRQARVRFDQGYLATTLVGHAPIARDLVALFHTRFDPKQGDRAAREAASAEIVARIEAELAKVTSLDDDRILRRFLNAVQSMLRTNFYQVAADGLPKSTISFKLDSKKVEGLPDPRPMVEIFVYSPRVEGVHLRFGRIARGGLRWSDRPQDYRTEVLGLVKAQQVKNAVIVPVGAKGGFVAKELPSPTNRQAWLDEGIAAYKLFVASLLDITDNLDANGAIVQRPNVFRWDGDDPYLVVAADKGTATFSDIANGISAEYGHWLGDAFASGGSAGYDHKKMGITARGAWEAVKRHFREIDIDIQTTPFDVVGVGDMSGDVFGNGVLLSEKIRLIAAFDHRDIFLDPSPDPATSFAERKRMFDLPRSSWQDYDKSLISPGGGVFSRSLKSMPLSPEIRAALRLDKAEATPQEVMNAILRAPVDLLWFGGIGTYVRASTETDDDAGDRANDAIRVAAPELNVRVIGEGANLGMTQRGRIEAGMRGIRLNTDAIDNSAGVNSSDVEVNFKIALGSVVAGGALDLEARNALLAEMTPDVAAIVLRNNIQQSLSLSLTERRGAEDIGFARRLMHQLESEGRLDRKVEYLPDDRELDARVQRNQGLTRPESAVLLAYAKLALKDDLLEGSVPDDAYLGRELTRYFPAVLAERYPAAIVGHRLRREIIATLLANAIINRGGATLGPRIADQTGASPSEIAAAFAAVRDVFGLTALNADIDALDNRISGKLQLSLYAGVQDLLIDRIVWFLRHGRLVDGLERVVGRFGTSVSTAAENLAALLPEAKAAELTARSAELTRDGVPEALARRLVALPTLADMTDVTLVAEAGHADLSVAARTYYAVGDMLRLSGIAERAKALQVSGYYDRLALDRAVSDLSAANRRIATTAVAGGGLDAWQAKAAAAVERTRTALAEIAGGGELTVPKLAVAAGLLADLAGS